MLVSDTFRLLLDSIGRSEEYEYYLQRFQKQDSAPFAILVPDLDAAQYAPAAIHFHLRFLSRIELYPAVLLAGPYADVMAATLTRHGDYEVCTSPDDQTELSEFRRRLKERRVPGIILDYRQPLFESLKKYSSELSSRIHFIRNRGGIKDLNGIPVNYAWPQMEPGSIDRDDHAIFRIMSELFLSRPNLHVSITSPLNLLKEIFTIKGAGTVFRKKSKIHKLDNIRQVDIKRLEGLLSASFKRPLLNADFFQSVSLFYIEENYRGAALISIAPSGISYLSKFAVDTQARGEGIAQEIWDAMINDNPRLFWRSRAANSIIRWYQRIADGYNRSGNWTVFWKDIEPEEIPGVIRYAIDLPSDFDENIQG